MNEKKYQILKPLVESEPEKQELILEKSDQPPAELDPNDNRARIFSIEETAKIGAAADEIKKKKALEYAASPEGQASQLAEDLIEETAGFLYMMDMGERQLDLNKAMEYIDGPKPQLMANLKFMGEPMPQTQEEIRALRAKMGTPEYSQKIVKLLLELKNHKKAA